MSMRTTLPRGVALARQATLARPAAPARHSERQVECRPAAAAVAHAGRLTVGRSVARTVRPIEAMAQPLTAFLETHLQLVRATSDRARDRERAGRRLLNIVVAAVGLVVTAPVMLLIAALIKLTSRGPVLFAQPRIGLDRRSLSRAGGNTRRHIDQGGRPFTMYKFRTMRPARPEDQQAWALPDDARVTPLGRLLRKYRLDELPQLVNVLLGDMNVVGPRPEQPTIFVYLREQIEAYQRRQRVRPGITGWAQINQGYDTSVDDVRRKVAYDLEYIRRQSALEDLKIMLRTVPVMALRRGGW